MIVPIGGRINERTGCVKTKHGTGGPNEPLTGIDQAPGGGPIADGHGDSVAEHDHIAPVGQLHAGTDTCIMPVPCTLSREVLGQKAQGN